jgi:diguanylate cyclase (GGDEF)-like protein
MKRTAGQVLADVLRPLARLLKVPLQIDDAAGTVRREDGQPLEDAEREVLGELLYLIGGVHEETIRATALEARVLKLEMANAELRATNKFLSDISARDPVTGLYNRWYVMEKIDSEINRAVRHSYPMSLMMLDLDHFAHINDSYGRIAGDDILKSVGQMLRESCRIYDVAGRYGGEQFCIVLPETKVEGTTTVAERIRERLESTTIPMGESDVRLTASIGIAGMDSIAEDGILSAGVLIDRAGRALDSAKHHGRNRVELWH